MSEFVTFVPRVSSFYFSEADNNGLNVLDQADFKHQILPGQEDAFYTQKYIMGEDVTVIVKTKTDATAPRLYICSRQVGLDNRPTVVAGIDLNVPPNYKGTQSIAGDNYVNPYDPTDTCTLDTTLWAFSFGSYAGVLPANEYYYVRLDAYVGANFYSYYSEPVYLRADKHPYTQYWAAGYKANRSGNSNVVVSGWFDDFPANTIPFMPEFGMRLESRVLPYDPKFINVSYLSQLYEVQGITAQQLPMRTLKLGDLTTGIPDYILQMASEFLIADSLIISGYGYTIYNPGGGTVPVDLWKSKRDENTPLLYASTAITTKYLAQQAMRRVSPCDCPNLVSAIMTLGGATYSANFTFNMAGGFTCPFTISGATGGGVPYTLHINSLSDLVSAGGDLYTKSFVIGGIATVSYTITMVTTGVVCAAGTLAYGCVGPAISSTALIGGGLIIYEIAIDYASCGDTCHDMVWTYAQVLPTAGDSGGFTDTVTCPPTPTTHTVTPAGVTPGVMVQYDLTATDCCGVVRFFSVTKRAPCSGIQLHNFTGSWLGGIGLDGGSTVAILLNVFLLAMDCNSFTMVYTQMNTGYASGVGNSGTVTRTPGGTSSAYPIDVAPNTTFTGYGGNINRIWYHIKITTCCGVVYEGDTQHI